MISLSMYCKTFVSISGIDLAQYRRMTKQQRDGDDIWYCESCTPRQSPEVSIIYVFVSPELYNNEKKKKKKPVQIQMYCQFFSLFLLKT